MAYNILIVDDSKIIRAMVKKSITMSGLTVGEIHEARDGVEALEVLASQWIDIVFADIHMPNMNGVQLVEQMSKDNLLVSIPVVIVSSDRSQKQIERLKVLGIRAYIKKPFRPESFRDTVAEVLEPMGGAQ
jgi:two-component system chemotaxis response regulator CheY